MRNRRTMLILVGLFAVLLLIALLQNGANPPPTPTSAPTETAVPALPTGTLLRVFPDMAVLDIQAVRLENPNSDETFTINRDADGNWASPDDDQFDPDTASDIARTLVLLPYGRSINVISTTNLEDYGFNPNGQFFISIIMKNGEGHVLAIGKLSESEPIYYMLLDERDEIFEVERGPIEYLMNFIF
jgi:hypothetical protein